MLVESPSALDGVLLFVLAAGLFISGLARGPKREAAVVEAGRSPTSFHEDQSAASPDLGEARERRAATFILAFTTAAAFVSFGGNRFTPLNVTLWAASLALFLWRFWERPPSNPLHQLWNARERVRSVRLSPAQLALIAIVLLAVGFRFYHLDTTPAEMTSDHAEKILDVMDVLEGERPIFFTRNTGREPFQFYLGALTVGALGVPVNHLALKLGTAAFGVFAIPWVYLLGKQLFGQNIGLLAAVLAAMSQWATAIDRVGLRFPFVAAFAAPSLYFLIRAFQSNRRNDWIACGLFAGVGLHTYTAMRVVPVLLAVLLGAKLLLDLGGRWQRQAGETDPVGDLTPSETSSLARGFWANALTGATAMGLVFLPLARYWQEAPTTFWFRILTRSTEAERPFSGNPGLVFADNVKNALLMFNYRGDQVPINTVPGSPTLDMITGGLFVLGIVYLIWRVGNSRDRRTAYLLTMLFFMLLPATSSVAFPNENPSIARAGGAGPIVMIIAALPLGLLIQRISQMAVTLSWSERRGRLLAVSAVAVALCFAARLNYEWYFIRYDRQWRATGWNTTEMGAVLRGFATSVGDLQHAYHVPYPYWADTRAIGINAGSPRWENALQLSSPAGLEKLGQAAGDPANKLYLLNVGDETGLRLLRETFPNGVAKVYRSERPGKDFWVFLAPGRSQSP